MSSDKTWHTKEQVLKDLAKISGRRVARAENLDSRHIVVGDGPPPRLRDPEEEEMRLLYGDSIDAVADIYSETEPPDLAGITAMLRMVLPSQAPSFPSLNIQKFDCEKVQAAEASDDDEDFTEIGEPSNYVLAISKGSRLNPNVQEFIPKGAFSSPSSSDLSEKCSTSVGKTDDSTTASVGKTDNPVTENAENIDDFKVKSAKTVDVELATKLKNEISDASKCNTFEIKQQRNVAISTLLRLYADNKETSPPKQNAPLKLITPDYFANRCSPETVKPEKSTSTPLENKTSTSPSMRKKISTPHSLSMSPRPSTSTSSSAGVRSEPALPTQAQSPKLKVDPLVKKSIEKVNNWLGGETVERKPPKVFLDPVAFKRRSPAACKSPPTAPTDAQEKVTSKPTPSNHYQPSNYAAELEKKYRERSKAAKKEKQKRNMWTDLDIILKEKDKKRLGQRSEDDDD